MQDFLYSEWNNQPHYDSLRRQRSPLKIQGTVEEKSRIDSVTNVHRKYLLYSSESRCVHLFQEKVTRYVRPARRHKPEKVRVRTTDCTTYSPPGRGWAPNIEVCGDHPLQRPCSQDHFFTKDYYDFASTKSRSCHSYLNMDISPDFTSPRFVRPCKLNKETNAKMEGGKRSELPALEMKPHSVEELMEFSPGNYVEEFKHLVRHYISEKSCERLEGSTLLMDTLSLIMSAISPYINSMLWMIWRIKCVAEKAIRLCVDCDFTVE